MTDSERAEAAAVKREARGQQQRDISDMILAGDTPAEISAKTGLTLAALWRLRLYWGLPLSVRRGSRRLPAWIPDGEVAALEPLAGDMAVDRGRALEAILKAALMDGAAVARRSLCVRRRAAA